MSGFNYPKTAATATRLLQRFGAPAQIEQQGNGDYDPGTGGAGSEDAASDDTTVNTTAAVFAYEQKYIDGTLVLQGDQQAFCAPSVAPVQGDGFVWQGKRHTVVSVKPVAPAGVPVLYEVQIRG